MRLTSTKSTNNVSVFVLQEKYNLSEDIFSTEVLNMSFLLLKRRKRRRNMDTEKCDNKFLQMIKEIIKGLKIIFEQFKEIPK